MKLLKRWLNYSDSGMIVGTRFVAHKTPLKEDYDSVLTLDQSFTPQNLLRKHENIRLVIDLTFTTKYYDGIKEFTKIGVQYVKIMCRGHEIPSQKNYAKFVRVVDNFVERTPESYLIGVHCTHGVNRTGYFIVRYMIEKLGYDPEAALRKFAEHRGHPIERTNYIVDILNKKKLDGNTQHTSTKAQKE